VVRVRIPPAALTRCEETLGELAEPPCEEPRAHQLAHLLLLLCGLVRHLDSEQLADAERCATAPTAVAHALALMASDLARPWTVQELADAVAVSPAHLSRLFHLAVGRPPMAHLGVLRAEAAAARLLRTAEPVSAVGAAVGWGDPNYFARRFRAHFGTSPTAFRSRLSGAARDSTTARR
jgi:AraC family L-rhamnose operon transcriptional activator RhaR